MNIFHGVVVLVLYLITTIFFSYLFLFGFLILTVFSSFLYAVPVLAVIVILIPVVTIKFIMKKWKYERMTSVVLIVGFCSWMVVMGITLMTCITHLDNSKKGPQQDAKIQTYI
ncbi:MAG: hypothetical protein AB1650_04150 [Candidatus Omnitrophota bacterium]